MTRTYATLRLLEHGPMTWREFREVTGWPTKVVARVLYDLTLAGKLDRRAGPGGRLLYVLA